MKRIQARVNIVDELAACCINEFDGAIATPANQSGSRGQPSGLQGPITMIIKAHQLFAGGISQNPNCFVRPRNGESVAGRRPRNPIDGIGREFPSDRLVTRFDIPDLHFP